MEKDWGIFQTDCKAEFTLGAGKLAVFFPIYAHAPKMKKPDKKTIEKIDIMVKV
jgi:beta-galactosidase beta subunit